MPLPPAIEAALHYLRNTDFSHMAVGRYPIDGEQMFALVQSPITQGWDAGKPEFHSRYIDIQYLLEGEELIGYAISDHTLSKKYDQLAERDIAFVAPIEHESSSLSDLDGRSEKSHGRDQILPDLQRQ
ncbi:YhcH/YjgK/YiaL family protein [Iodobacter fluviatilis]|uniref:Uncharacterized protein n=1 Tax=Iodobacter fluviatilis TaxID=537 RepID=A0A7G3G5I4_9NEIS|nr:YhcH/YjgK/YiaL family protein [Iodobacter fluviatilis]QBC42399.1 hypothetical protein C1H71_01685 [Iodobacter fluviatilis]